MSRLTIFNEYNPQNPVQVLSNAQEITNALKGEGVLFEQWEASAVISGQSTQEEILAAYAAQVEKLKAEGGYQVADVINLTPDNPNKTELRKKFLDEHIHSEDEVRFFVKGDGLFYLHLGDKVYAVQCEQGDLISVPANSNHWFDMGENPDFTCIRIFTNPEGWVAQYTGNKIADLFPKYEALAQ